MMKLDHILTVYQIKMKTVIFFFFGLFVFYVWLRDHCAALQTASQLATAIWAQIQQACADDDYFFMYVISERVHHKNLCINQNL